MTVETLPFDSARYLRPQKDTALYLQAVLDENDPGLFRHALGQVAATQEEDRDRPQTRLAREALYRALSATAIQSIATIMKAMTALGIHLSVDAI